MSEDTQYLTVLTATDPDEAPSFTYEILGVYEVDSSTPSTDVSVILGTTQLHLNDEVTSNIIYFGRYFNDGSCLNCFLVLAVLINVTRVTRVP